MKKIYVHGLGQTPEIWQPVIEKFKDVNDIVCVDLANLMKDNEVNYNNLYKAFAFTCNQYDGKIDLCGLSLGAVLCLNYAIDYPDKVDSLILIAVQYKMPKLLLKIQNLIFRFMPNSSFQQTGFGKADFIRLCRTMAELDFSKLLSNVLCRTLVMCGEKDSANRKATVELSDCLNNAELQIVHGVGHELNADAPEQLSKVIKEF